MKTRLLLCLYWFVMTAALGIYYPYFSLYLSDALGFTGVQIGLAYSVAPVMGMLAQPLWGQIADRSGSRTRVLALLSLGTAAGYGMLTRTHTFAGVIAATAWLSFFWTAQIPMAVAVSLAAIARDAGHTTFGRVRVWGTIGFLITVVGVPPVLRRLADLTHSSERETFHIIFGLAASLALLAALCALSLPDTPAHARFRARQEDLRWLRQHGPYLRMLVVSFAAYAVLQGPMVLFPVYVRARGGDATSISHMWIFMLSVEIVLMLTAARLYAWLGATRLITLGVLAWSCRWLACALCHELTWVYPLQMLHAVLILSLQVAAPLLVESLVPERLRASGQAGLNLAGSCLGGIVSSTIAGRLLDAYDIDVVMTVAGSAGLALALIVPRLLPREHSV